MLQNSPKAMNLREVLVAHQLHIVGSEPTFFHGRGSSQLDLHLSNNLSDVLRFSQIEAPVFSNHDIIFASLDFDTIHVDNNVINYRDYSRINAEQLGHDIESINSAVACGWPGWQPPWAPGFRGRQSGIFCEFIFSTGIFWSVF